MKVSVDASNRVTYAWGTASGAEGSSLSSGNYVGIVDTYSGGTAGAQFGVSKTMSTTGTAYSSTGKGTVTFTLEGLDGAPMPEKTTITMDVSKLGTAAVADSFGEIGGLTGGHSYEYRITETKSGTDVGGLTVSVPVYVKVSVDASNRVTYAWGTAKGAEGSSLSNGNYVGIKDNYLGYSASGSISFYGKKVYNETLKAGDFTFVVKEDNVEVASGSNDSQGNIVFSKISYSLSNIGTHTYKVMEISGEEKDITYDNIIYTVTVTVSDNKDGTLKIIPSANYDTLDFNNIANAKITITKKSSDTKQPLQGTVYAIYTDEACTPASYVEDMPATDAKGVSVSGWLTAGKTYYLKEKTPPAGYSTSNKVYKADLKNAAAGATVTVSNGDLDGGIVVDSKTLINIAKVDANGNLLAGASLQVLDASGKVVDSWTSESGAAHQITGLSVGNYTLHEVTAPSGYATAADVAFTINNDGTLTLGGTTVARVNMVDKTSTSSSDSSSGPSTSDSTNSGNHTNSNDSVTTSNTSNRGNHNNSTITTSSTATRNNGNSNTTVSSSTVNSNGGIVGTGDSSQIALYLILLAFAGCVGAFAAVEIRRRKKN